MGDSFTKLRGKGFLGVMEARLDCARRNAEHGGNVIDAQVVEEEEGQGLAVRKGETVETGVNGGRIFG